MIVVVPPKKENDTHTEGGCVWMLLSLVGFIAVLTLIAILG